ncbi:hypothetical protein NDU88_001343 [Pleurodeles waltl]|uniref:Uncharacterized protein n=1 Tax=Pleurodeles waltl TaxID=8319 RepID=A0AAV7U682_PLEWA|nr:hypothetical protein NDU88_001343 [Pleurodeles waltl]
MGLRRWRAWTGQSKEQAARERAQAVAEVEHRARSPIMSVQEHIDDDKLEIDSDLADALQGSGPPVTPQTTDDLI